MASYANDLEVVIYTISLGDSADLNLMQDIADITGGTHFNATGVGAANTAFDCGIRSGYGVVATIVLGQVTNSMFRLTTSWYELYIK